MVTFPEISTSTKIFAKSNFAINTNIVIRSTVAESGIISIRNIMGDWIELGSLSLINGDSTYTFSITADNYTTIIGTEESITAELKCVANGITYTSEQFTLVKSVLLITNPNSNNNDSNKSSVYYKSYCNIIWTDEQSNEYVYVDIGISKDNSTWTTIGAAKINNGQYLFRLWDYNTYIPISGSETIYIKVTSNAGFARYHTIATTFTDVEANANLDSNYGTGEVSNQMDYPDRFEHYATMAGEKAVRIDEAITLGQLEPGKGIRITQRDFNGDANLLEGESSAGKSGAYNLVVETDAVVPRTLYGIINIDNYSLDADYQAIGSYAKYGRLAYTDIVHNWNLTTYWDNLMVEISQVNRGEEFADYRVSKAWYKAIGANTIRVFYIDKSLNDSIFIGDDQSVEITWSKRFRLKLVEILGDLSV